ncbi:MAG: hypothetical protein ABI237_18090 [Ginsengibacter sp.]
MKKVIQREIVCFSKDATVFTSTSFLPVVVVQRNRLFTDSGDRESG